MNKFSKLLSLIGVSLSLSLISNQALAESISQTYSVTPNGTLMVDTDNGSINIRTHDKETVEIDVDIDGPDADQFSVKFEQSSNGINVFGELDHDNWSWNRKLRVKFLFYVPKNYNIDVDTAGGSIKIDDLTGNVDAETSGGSISLGDIIGDVDVHTSGGSIKVDSVYGDIDANTSGGSVDVTFTKQITEDAKLSTSGGSISATLPKDIKLDLAASTSGGSVKTEFNVDGRIKKQSINGLINGGGPKLTLRTSGGSVRINQL